MISLIAEITLTVGNLKANSGHNDPSAITRTYSFISILTVVINLPVVNIKVQRSNLSWDLQYLESKFTQPSTLFTCVPLFLVVREWHIAAVTGWATGHAPEMRYAPLRRARSRRIATVTFEGNFERIDEKVWIWICSQIAYISEDVSYFDNP